MLSLDNIQDSIEKIISKEVYDLLNLSEFEKITTVYSSITSIQIEINGRPLIFDDAPFSGITNFEHNGFHFGREAFASEEELIKTIVSKLIESSSSDAIQYIIPKSIVTNNADDVGNNVIKASLKKNGSEVVVSRIEEGSGNFF